VPESDGLVPQSKGLKRVARAFGGLAFLLIVLRMVIPKLVFDTTSLSLFGIAAACFLLPYLPPLKRLKILEIEAEFEARIEKAVDALARTVNEVEKKPSAQALPLRSKKEEIAGPYPPMWQEYVREYQAILTSTATNTEKIIAANVLLEKMIQTAAVDLGLDAHITRGPTARIIEELARQGFLTAPECEAFREMSDIRNLVVHGGVEARPTDRQTGRVLDLLYRLVRTFA